MPHGRRRGQHGPNDDLTIFPVANVADEATPSTDRRDDEPSERLILGVVSVPAPDPVAIRREQWRAAGARRRARVKASEGLGWAFPNDVPRGLGDNPGTGRHAVVERGASDGREDPDHR